MTNTNSTSYRYLDRAPMIDDIVTVTPNSENLFDVVALDDLYGQLIYVQPHDSRDESPARWVSLTYVRVIDDEDPMAWEG